MKIVIVHYRFFISGGPETYMFNIINSLELHGHEVIPFSIQHNNNKPSLYSSYFLDPIGNGTEIYENEYRRDFKTIRKVLGRMLYSFEAKRKLKKLLLETNPDLVYVLQYQNKMSCSIIDAVHELGIPLVQRISDFGHICINNAFYTNGLVCERCLHGNNLNGIKFKCFNNSYFNSFIKVLALRIQKIRNIKSKISSFIIPADFTVSKFVEFGVDRHKIHHIPTFFSDNAIENEGIIYGDFFLYVGRIEKEKGLLTLVKSFVNTKLNLIIIGFSSSGYDNYLKSYLEDKSHNIIFTGKLAFDEIKSYLKRCLCTICPSEWYDNFPNVVLESYAYKKAVIASNLGSLRELVDNNETGFLFEAGNELELSERVYTLFNNNSKAVEMGNNSYNKMRREYSMELHYSRLINVFDNEVSNNKLS